MQDKIKKPIKIELKLNGGKDSVIPKGVTETLKIEVVDGGATFKFNDCGTTKRFAAKQFLDGVESVYVERKQKTYCKYPDMTQEDIVKHVKDRLQELQK